MGTREVLRRLGVKPSKDRGQSFLVDERALDAIIDFGTPASERSIVEIGAGVGALTERLASFSDVTVIEVEEAFCADLERRFPAVTVIQHDIRFFDLSSLGSGLLVFGNLPYAISTDIVFHLIKSRGCISRAVLMLQREFVERMAANPGSRTYGALSVGCQLWAAVRTGPVIPGTSFYPATEVESMVVEVDFAGAPDYGVRDESFLRQVVKAAFMRRRKKLKNSLKMSGFFDSGLIDRALNSLDLDPACRAEMLSPAQFVKLANRLKQGGIPHDH